MFHSPPQPMSDLILTRHTVETIYISNMICFSIPILSFCAGPNHTLFVPAVCNRRNHLMACSLEECIFLFMNHVSLSSWSTFPFLLASHSVQCSIGNRNWVRVRPVAPWRSCCSWHGIASLSSNHFCILLHIYQC